VQDQCHGVRARRWTIGRSSTPVSAASARAERHLHHATRRIRSRPRRVTDIRGGCDGGDGERRPGDGRHGRVERADFVERAVGSWRPALVVDRSRPPQPRLAQQLAQLVSQPFELARRIAQRRGPLSQRRIARRQQPLAQRRRVAQERSERRIARRIAQRIAQRVARRVEGRVEGRIAKQRIAKQRVALALGLTLEPTPQLGTQPVVERSGTTLALS
jgi:hypothetical protein